VGRFIFLRKVERQSNSFEVGDTLSKESPGIINLLMQYLSLIIKSSSKIALISSRSDSTIWKSEAKRILIITSYNRFLILLGNAEFIRNNIMLGLLKFEQPLIL